jgi:hypothetical protein
MSANHKNFHQSLIAQISHSETRNSTSLNVSNDLAETEKIPLTIPTANSDNFCRQNLTNMFREKNQTITANLTANHQKILQKNAQQKSNIDQHQKKDRKAQNLTYSLVKILQSKLDQKDREIKILAYEKKSILDGHGLALRGLEAELAKSERLVGVLGEKLENLEGERDRDIENFWMRDCDTGRRYKALEKKYREL